MYAWQRLKLTANTQTKISSESEQETHKNDQLEVMTSWLTWSNMHGSTFNCKTLHIYQELKFRPTGLKILFKNSRILLK